MVKKNSRDMVGYGSKGKDINWPNNSKLALQFVLNYEEGGENSVLNGDKSSETFLSEIIGAKAIKGRHISMESIYEYGSRAGFWRLDRLFREKKIPVTIFGVGLALEQNPEICEAIKNGNYEIAAHGYRWIDYQEIVTGIFFSLNNLSNRQNPALEPYS
jgi:peptidoglycan/xylan/chitin deacetylase (PgdA/CDA1 family)